MKLRQIEYATAIARTLSLSAAADVCNASQPALSTGLAQLEQELGGKLFHRTTRQVEITPFGRHMMPYLEAVLSARLEAGAAAEAFLKPARKLLRIGISPLVDIGLVTSITEAFRAQHPDVEVFYKECLLGDLEGRLETGGIDLTILPCDAMPDGLDRLEFYSDPMRYLPMGGIGGRQGRALNAATLPGDPIIMTGGGCGLNRALETLFAREGINLSAYPGYALSYSVIQEWTWLGFGAAFLPAGKLANAKADSLPVFHRDGTPWSFDFAWGWRYSAREISHVDEFVRFLRQAGPSLVQGQLRQQA